MGTGLHWKNIHRDLGGGGVDVPKLLQQPGFLCYAENHSHLLPLPADVTVSLQSPTSLFCIYLSEKTGQNLLSPFPDPLPFYRNHIAKFYRHGIFFCKICDVSHLQYAFFTKEEHFPKEAYVRVCIFCKKNHKKAYPLVLSIGMGLFIIQAAVPM